MASRVHAAVTALALVMSSLLGMLHEATTAHVLCAQHGELTHGVMTAGNAPDRAARLQGAQTASIEGHEHCALSSATRQSRVLPRPPTLVGASVAIPETAVAPPPRLAARDRGVYRTAPKTSPPA